MCVCNLLPSFTNCTSHLVAHRLSLLIDIFHVVKWTHRRKPRWLWTQTQLLTHCRLQAAWLVRLLTQPCSLPPSLFPSGTNHEFLPWASMKAITEDEIGRLWQWTKVCVCVCVYTLVSTVSCPEVCVSKNVPSPSYYVLFNLVLCMRSHSDC